MGHQNSRSSSHLSAVYTAADDMIIQFTDTYTWMQNKVYMGCSVIDKCIDQWIYPNHFITVYGDGLG